MRTIATAFRPEGDLGLLMKRSHLFIWPMLAVFIAKYVLEIADGGDAWKTGDWLINYQAGAVRRGLFGQLLISVADIGVNLRWLTFIAQSVIYVGIFYLVTQIYLMRPRRLTWCIFILSPAFILTPFFDFQGGFRKEILLFLSFSMIAFAYARNNLNTKAILGGYLLYLVAVFSHELAAMALPFYLYVFYRSAREGALKPNLAWYFSGLFLVTAAIAGVFAIDFPGNATVADGICESLLSRGFKGDICSGAIDWLKFDTKHGFELVRERWQTDLFTYAPLLILSIAPILITNSLRGLRLILFIVGFLAFLPLYFVAIDWGRWINVYVFLTFVLILAEPDADRIDIKPLPLWLILIYLTTWSVPHCCKNRPAFGWLEWISKAYSQIL